VFPLREDPPLEIGGEAVTITARVMNAAAQTMTLSFDGFFVNFMFFCIGLAALTVAVHSDKEK
jgi:hypothetical protein